MLYTTSIRRLASKAYSWSNLKYHSTCVPQPTSANLTKNKGRNFCVCGSCNSHFKILVFNTCNCTL